MDVEKYLARDSLSGEEQVVMALITPFYDAEHNRVSKSAFEKPDTSVSRLSVSKLEDIISVFRRDLDRPHRLVEGYGLINVEAIRCAGKDVDDLDLDVTADPIECPVESINKAHAEIVAFNEKRNGLRKSGLLTPVRLSQ